MRRRLTSDYPKNPAQSGTPTDCSPSAPNRSIGRETRQSTDRFGGLGPVPAWKGRIQTAGQEVATGAAQSLKRLPDGDNRR